MAPFDTSIMKLVVFASDLVKDFEVLARSRPDDPATTEAIERYQDLLDTAREALMKQGDPYPLKDAKEGITNSGLFTLAGALNSSLKAAVL